MKTQMKFQRIMCLLMIIVGALSLVYSFLFCSAGMANIGLSISRKTDGSINYRKNFQQAQDVYLDAQHVNNLMLILAIVMIVAGALLYITATNKRRTYHISNYVATGVVCGFDVVAAIYLMVQDAIFLGRFQGIINDPALNAEFQKVADRNPNISYDSSIWNFAIGFVVYALVILACGGLILNLVWKIKLMQGEKKLLSGELVKEEV